MKEFIVEKKDSGQRVDKYLLRIMPNASKSFLYKMMRKKNIVINDKKIEGNEILNLNDSIKIWFSDETFNKFATVVSDVINTKEYIDAFNKFKGIDILFENEHFLVIYKPAGILSQKAADSDLSINEWIVGYCLNNNSVTKDSLVSCKPSIVNRLDRNTSGIVLAGKTVYGLNLLTKIVRDRSLKKYYLTYVLGQLDDEKLLVGYHLKDSDKNIVSIIDENQFDFLDEHEKHKYNQVKTYYKSLKKCKTTIDGQVTDVSLVEIDLITGKSHQIRAHMAHIGHPLVGDDKYGKRSINAKFGLKYQLLHAYKVVFPQNDELLELSGKEIVCQHSNLEAFEDRFLKNS